MLSILIGILGLILKYTGYICFCFTTLAFAVFGDSTVKIMLYVIGCFAAICIGNILKEVAECL